MSPENFVPSALVPVTAMVIVGLELGITVAVTGRDKLELTTFTW